ncbi:hypothetical protein HKX48_005665 [Thoreauomyces humboldtii]|nr:hypothetical protein HKX48_005665 [Thoreauomyces humboldtii]
MENRPKGPEKKHSNPGEYAARFAQQGAQQALNFGKGGFKVAGSVWDDFRTFIQRGNVVDLAVGLVMGAAFTAIVTSLVTDLLTPILSIAMKSNLQNNFAVLKCPKNQTSCAHDDWPTVLDAQKAGAVTWNWGNFLATIFNFIVISVIIFMLLKIYTAARRIPPKPKTTKECTFCFKDIPLKAVRCPECTSHLEESMMPINKPDSVITIDHAKAM